MLKKTLFLGIFVGSLLYSSQIVIATGGKLGNYYKVGNDINEKVYNGKAKVINTEGSLENMLLVANGKADIALVQADALAMLETFYMSEGKKKEDLVEVMGSLYEKTVHILVPEKSTLYNIEELNNKVIVSGGLASGTTLTAASIAEEYGIKFKSIRNSSTEKGIKLLKRNKIDALFYVVKSPSDALVKYKNFRMIEVVDEGNKNEYLKSVTLPQETYKFLDYDTRTYAIDTIVIVKKGSREKARIKDYLSTLSTAVVNNDDFVANDEIKEKVKQTFTIQKEIIEQFAKRYGNAALVRLNYLDRALKRLQTKSLTEQLAKVNTLVNKLNYATDRQHWKQENYWATPLETLGTSYTDTEDAALLKYLLLVKLGLNPNNIQLIEKKTSYNSKDFLSSENVSLLYFPDLSKDPIVLDYSQESLLPYRYEKQFKYAIIKKAENPLWNKLFESDMTNQDVDDIMMVLGEKR